MENVEGVFAEEFVPVELVAPQKPKKKKVSKTERNERIIAFLFILLPVIGFTIFTALSIAFTFLYSFQEYYPGRGETEGWVGFQHYVNLFTGITGEAFGRAIGNTLFLMLSLVFSTVLGLLLAGLLRLGEIKGSKIYQILYYLPAVSSAVALNIVWRYIFQYDNGLLNTVLGAHVNWLTDPTLVKVAIVIKNSFNAMGGAMILYLAGMLNVSKELYEASSLDGAGKVKQFFSITLPMITPVTFYILITGLIGGLQSYADSAVFADNLIGAQTIVHLIFQQMDNNGAQGYGIATAASMFLSVCIMIITIIQFKLSNKWVYEE